MAVSPTADVKQLLIARKSEKTSWKLCFCSIRGRLWPRFAPKSPRNRRFERGMTLERRGHDDELEVRQLVLDTGIRKPYSLLSRPYLPQMTLLSRLSTAPKPLEDLKDPRFPLSLSALESHGPLRELRHVGRGCSP